jgi:hypothetical protein
MSGPCQICGATGYALSFGGPGICPACDCGVDPKLAQAQLRIAELTSEVARLRTALSASGEAKKDAERLKLLEEAGRLLAQAQIALDECTRYGAGNWNGLSERITQFVIAAINEPGAALAQLEGK